MQWRLMQARKKTKRFSVFFIPNELKTACFPTPSTVSRILKIPSVKNYLDL